VVIQDAHIVQLNRENYKAPNLTKILGDERITKIFHYGRADMAHIKYYLKTDTKNVLDTKIASKLARSYSDSHSLKVLIKEFINIDISKQFQSSDFGGELSQAQLKYCANDVIYLHQIHDELNKILIRENRVNLYHDCLKFLKTRVDLDLASFNDDIWSH
jgi:ribonuclease D